MVKNKNTYPVQYVEPVQLKDGTLVVLRPIHWTDDKNFEEAKEMVSSESLYQRFLGFVNIDDEMIARFTQLDYRKEMAIIAEVKNGEDKQMIAVARIAPYDEEKAEFAIIITDAWQGKGLGKIMTSFILDIAKDLGYKQVYAFLFSENGAMNHILQKEGFEVKSNDGLITKSVLTFGEEKRNSQDWFRDFIADIS